MAALEKIRSKAVLLVVFIGVALLAFILTDFLNSGRAFFGDGNTVAKVGNTKIDAMDFQRRYEIVSQQMQSNRSNIDGAMLQSEVMNQMIQEILLNDELDALDINVSDVEITEAIIGNNVRQHRYTSCVTLCSIISDKRNDRTIYIRLYQKGLIANYKSLNSFTNRAFCFVLLYVSRMA